MEIQALYRDMDLTDNPGAEALRISGKRGALLSLLYTPGRRTQAPAVLLSHGFPGNEQNMDLAQGLRRLGFAVMTYHYSGSWGSDGEFSFLNCIEDANTVLDALMTHPAVNPERIYAVGHSMGGFVTAHLAAQRPEIRGSVLLCPWDACRSFALARGNLMHILSGGYGYLRDANEEKFLEELGANEEALRLDHLAPRLAGRSLCCIAAMEDEDLPLDLHARPFRDAMAAAGAEQFRYREIHGDHCFNATRLTLIDTVARELLDMEE